MRRPGSRSPGGEDRRHPEVDCRREFGPSRQAGRWAVANDGDWAGEGDGKEATVSSQLSVAKVLANLEAQMALHKEREAYQDRKSVV